MSALREAVAEALKARQELEEMEVFRNNFESVFSELQRYFWTRLQFSMVIAVSGTAGDCDCVLYSGTAQLDLAPA